MLQNFHFQVNFTGKVSRKSFRVAMYCRELRVRLGGADKRECAVCHFLTAVVLTQGGVWVDRTPSKIKFNINSYRVGHGGHKLIN